MHKKGKQALKYPPVTQSILCLIFLIHERTTQHLNYGGQDFIKQYAVYDSDTHVTLKQDPSHQTWYDLVHPKQGYNNAMFEKPHLNNVHEKSWW